MPRDAVRELVPARVGDHGGFLGVVVEGRDRGRPIGDAHGAGRITLDARRGPERRFRGGDDRVGGPVVVRQRDGSAAGEVPGEVVERRRVGARERVDRLRTVTDDGQVGAVAEPRPQQPRLERRRVLELVDEEVAEPPALGGCEVGVGLDRVGAAAEEVVEVEPALPALLGLVARVQLGELRRGAGQAAFGVAGGGRVLLGGDHPGLGPLDLGRDVGDRECRRGAGCPFAEQGREHPALAVEDARGFLAAIGGAAPQLRECERVERARGDGAVDPERVEAVDQLARGAAGERDREHMARLGVAFPDPERDAAGQDARLARSSGRQDGERRVRVGDRGALMGVEVGQQRVAWGGDR